MHGGRRSNLDCSLPSVEFVRDYALRRGMSVNFHPNGSAALSFAWVYVDYFASLAGKEKDLQRLNAFLNHSLGMIEDSHVAPNAYLVRIDVGEG